MAKGSQERRMLFDLRGRRKRVIQVAYVFLAVIMALSLFTVVGPSAGFLGDIFGTSSSSSSDALDQQASKLEAKLRRDPKNEQLLLALVRTRYSAGNTQVQVDPSTGQQSFSAEAFTEFRKAGTAWRRYIALDPAKPSVNTASLAASALFYSAAGATSVTQFKGSIGAALDAQTIVAQDRPSINSYVVLARYAYLAGDVPAGDDAAAKAQEKTPKAQRKTVERLTASYKKQGAQVQKQVEKIAKAQKSQGKQALQSPLGGLQGSSPGGLGTP
jgi:hypothetical protein